MKLRLYHGSKAGLDGAISPVRSRTARESARQRELAMARTDQIFRSWRHRDGLYFDEILAQMAKDDAECPPADEQLTGGVR